MNDLKRFYETLKFLYQLVLCGKLVSSLESHIILDESLRVIFHFHYSMLNLTH